MYFDHGLGWVGSGREIHFYIELAEVPDIVQDNLIVLDLNISSARFLFIKNERGRIRSSC